MNNADVNAKSNFNILSIQTRLLGKISGNEAFGANTSGQIEAAFFGTSDGDINGLMLRHAFEKFDWEKTSLLVGQTWHPMFITEVFPGVVSFNTWAPFQLFARDPQIGFTQSIESILLIFTAASLRDFTSNGPDCFSSSYLRNSVIPNLNAQVQFTMGSNIFGVGLDFKKNTPRLVTTKNFITEKSISTLSLTGYFKFNPDPVTIKSQVVYGSNLADLMMLGGYAVRATNIDNLFRISPRIQSNSGKSRISTELEYTSAAYGKNDNSNRGKVIDTKNISNLRLLLAVYYFF